MKKLLLSVILILLMSACNAEQNEYVAPVSANVRYKNLFATDININEYTVYAENYGSCDYGVFKKIYSKDDKAWVIRTTGCGLGDYKDPYYIHVDNRLISVGDAIDDDIITFNDFIDADLGTLIPNDEVVSTWVNSSDD